MSGSVPLRVAVVGCGLIGGKRAAALGADRLVACHDAEWARAEALAAAAGGEACATLDALLGHAPDVVVVATTHDALADVAVAALGAGAHVLVEKPAGRNRDDVERIRAAAASAGRRVKVGFNHRFHPGTARAAAEATSGRFGPLLFLRARYGQGGRLGYEREWRADPAVAGGGELIDQGMHLIDLAHWLLGPLPLHDALLRTSFWDTTVEDNAVLTLGDGADRRAPWATFHVSSSEWKNGFDLELYCRTGKLHVVGLAGSYGPQSLRIYTMRPEMGPPDLEEIAYPEGDASWAAEWSHLRGALAADDGRPLSGDLDDAAYAHDVVAEAYARTGYAERWAAEAAR